MRDEHLSMEPDAVESMQNNLRRGEPAIFASYTLIGAILMLGGGGLLPTATWVPHRGVCSPAC